MRSIARRAVSRGTSILDPTTDGPSTHAGEVSSPWPQRRGEDPHAGACGAPASTPRGTCRGGETIGPSARRTRQGHGPSAPGGGERRSVRFGGVGPLLVLGCREALARSPGRCRPRGGVPPLPRPPRVLDGSASRGRPEDRRGDRPRCRTAGATPQRPSRPPPASYRRRVGDGREPDAGRTGPPDRACRLVRSSACP